jgi:type I restriction enzyme S subunit
MRNTRTNPLLRFPEFKENWKFKFGNEVFEPISNKKHNSDLPILAISQEFGAVPRDLINYQISVTEQSISTYKVVDIGDFIISLRSFQGGIEYSNYKGICSPAYIILRSKIEIENQFFKYYLKTYNYIQNLQRTLEGIRDGKMISYKYFSEIKLPLPSLDEQKKIANFLIQIDNRIAQLTEKKEHLELYKKGITQKIFSKKLRFKDENGKDFPDWETKKLKDIFLRKSIKNKGSLIKNVLTNSATRGIILQGDYFDKDIANQNNLEGYYIVDVNDFVYNPRISVSAPVGPLKRNHLVKGVMSPLYTVLKPKIGDLSFYEHYFQTSFWYKYMRGVANYGVRHDRMNITNDDFEKLPLPFPLIKEQEKIASFLNEISKQIELVTVQLEETQKFKKGLLQNMFI